MAKIDLEPRDSDRPGGGDPPGDPFSCIVALAALIGRAFFYAVVTVLVCLVAIGGWILLAWLLSLPTGAGGAEFFPDLGGGIPRHG